MSAPGPKPVSVVDGIVVPVDRANVDTDAILPKQYMKSISRTGFGDYLFDEWRYLDHGELGQPVAQRRLNPDSVFNQARYAGASILSARKNFGCGSSREHAPWALRDFGIQALIAPSFADIFAGNCLKNNLLPVVLQEQEVDSLFDEVLATPGARFRVSVADQSVVSSAGQLFHFNIEAGAKRRLLEGLDEVALTLLLADKIQAYECVRVKREPWLFSSTSGA